MASEAFRTVTFAALNDVAELGGGASGINLQSIAVQSVGTWGTLTVIAEASLDGTNWVALFAQNLATGVAAAFSLTVTGTLLRVETTALTKVRLRCSAFTSGVGQVFWDYGNHGTRV